MDALIHPYLPVGWQCHRGIYPSILLLSLPFPRLCLLTTQRPSDPTFSFSLLSLSFTAPQSFLPTPSYPPPGKSSLALAIALDLQADRLALAHLEYLPCASLAAEPPAEARKRLVEAAARCVRLAPAVMVLDDLDRLAGGGGGKGEGEMEGGEEGGDGAAAAADFLTDLLDSCQVSNGSLQSVKLQACVRHLTRLCPSPPVILCTCNQEIDYRSLPLNGLALCSGHLLRPPLHPSCKRSTST